MSSRHPAAGKCSPGLDQHPRLRLVAWGDEIHGRESGRRREQSKTDNEDLLAPERSTECAEVDIRSRQPDGLPDVTPPIRLHANLHDRSHTNAATRARLVTQLQTIMVDGPLSSHHQALITTGGANPARAATAVWMRRICKRTQPKSISGCADR
jgi:hypothetical protein